MNKFLLTGDKLMYINKLANIFNEYDNTYHRTIKIKLIDIKFSTYLFWCKKQ